MILVSASYCVFIVRFSIKKLAINLSLANDSGLFFLFKKTVASSIHSSASTQVIFEHFVLRNVNFYQGILTSLMIVFQYFLNPRTCFISICLLVNAPIFFILYKIKLNYKEGRRLKGLI